MKSPFQGRVLVTGAARRVGRAIALAFAQRGYAVTVTARTRSTDLLHTEELLNTIAREAGRGVGAEAVAIDFTGPSEVERFLEQHAREAWDVLVLNASSYDRSGVPSDDVRDATRMAAEAESHFLVNASTALALAVGFAPALARSALPGGGAIVALGDMHADGRPVRGYTPYLMSKAALAQMVKSLAVELAPRVRVNAVLPGVVAWPDDTTAAHRDAYEARIPLERSGTPEDAARAVTWLALDAPYVTGVELRVDGGRWLR